MSAALVLYLVIGLGGLTYGRCRDGQVHDNILKSFDRDDVLVNIARIAMSVVLCFCFPLILIPCRGSLLRWVRGRPGQGPTTYLPTPPTYLSV